MKHVLLLLSATACASAYLVSDALSLLTKMADSQIQRGVPKDGGYMTATFYFGLEDVISATKDAKYVSWYQSQLDGGVVLNNGTINGWKPSFYSLDDFRIGNSILWWYERTRELKYVSAAAVIRRHFDTYPRTASGGFWHKQYYPHQMWLDGIFMADSFYAKWTRLFDAHNQTAWNDIKTQFDLIESHCQDGRTGLLFHGYDESKTQKWANRVTGASPLVWDRADGWYFMSLLEVIEVFPKTHPGYAKLVSYFRRLAAGLKAAQDRSGGWWIVMSQPYPGKRGNYIESSGTAMFTYGMLKGVRLGLLPAGQYIPAATKAYQLLLNRFVKVGARGALNWEGTVKVGSLGPTVSFQTYIAPNIDVNDLKGIGPFLRASYEMGVHQKRIVPKK